MSWDCTLLDAGGLAPAARKPPGDSFTGDEKLQAEGKMDKAKGAAHEAAGDVKDQSPRHDEVSSATTRYTADLRHAMVAAGWKDTFAVAA